MFKKEDFTEFTIFELLQNIWDYTCSLKNNNRAKYWFWIPKYKALCKEYLEKKRKPCLPDLNFVLERIDELNILHCPEDCGGDIEKYTEFLVKFKDTLKRIQLCFCRQCRRRSRRSCNSVVHY